MQESTLTKIVIIIFFLGVIVLFAYLLTAKFDEKLISAVSDNDLDKTVKITGIITNLQNNKDHVFLTIAQQCYMNASLFYAGNSTELNTGENIEIIGKIQKSGDNYVIIADEVRQK